MKERDEVNIPHVHKGKRATIKREVTFLKSLV